MTGELCPHCFAPPRADGRPGCACAARGADLPDLTPTAALPEIPETGPNPDDLRLFDEAPQTTGPADAGSAATGGAAGDGPGATPSGATGSGDGPEEGGAGATGGRPARHRRRRPLAIVIAAAVLVAVVGTVAFGTGLLGGQSGDASDDQALTDDRAATPSAALSTWDGRMTDGATPPPSSTATPSPSASRSRGESPSATPSATPSPTREPSASPSASSARPSDTGAPDRPSERPTPATSAPTDPPRPTTPAGPPVLRQGDSGPEVAELQDRLRQTWTYVGAADGEYDAGVTDAVGTYQRRHDITADPEGVYGPHTRDYLEARTDQP
ncbi:peptidoglycan-binding domain-containing protein [Streptomyces sp. 71268]|uniref:peptidoglycan-binding domain-containing protein n=1 Tax=Streptomyces sp. 71268 TaxID=3002640 RepID=UPI0023F73030|nr:peptidoglycan-binding domain-containing protein [Streptomyces sp. 71268]WEV28088.1 peptidoglycan-binding domain-containing protein [Streptomyces sp. 71268]